MEYNGYYGVVEYDADAKIFHGDIINTKDIITFQGTTVTEIEQAFKDSIDEYLAWCEAEGAKPEQPYSGICNVRLPPELYTQTALMAQKLRMPFNSFVEKALTDELAVLQHH